MNYPQSKEILEKIKSANRILLNCHKGPDVDSISSALAMNYFLKSLDKEVEIICPDDVWGCEFLPGIGEIKKVDYSIFDFTKYDLFITQDTSSMDGVTGIKDFPISGVDIVVIDHHKTNTCFGNINLIDGNAISCTEVLYKIFSDWKYTIDSKLATILLSGIISDTGCFQYQDSRKSALQIPNELILKGADKDLIILNIFRRIPFERIIGVGKILIDSKLENNFIWSALNYEEFLKNGGDKDSKGLAAGVLLQHVDKTDFGLIMVEIEPNVISVSLRARTSFDVSRIAVELGGGGHKAASGAVIKDLPFEQAVEKVLNIARNYAK